MDNFFDNKIRNVGDDLAQSISRDAKVRISANVFSIYGFEALKGDPFHYGKKKNWTGAKEGAYYASNVPTGHENILPGDVTTHKVFMVKKTTCKLKSRSPKRSKKISYTGSFSDLVGKRYGR